VSFRVKTPNKPQLMPAMVAIWDVTPLLWCIVSNPFTTYVMIFFPCFQNNINGTLFVPKHGKI
jgi:hypothetical protein